MKKIFLLSIVVFSFVGANRAQSFNNAKKAFNAYLIDPTNNKTKLKEAKDEIEFAIADANNEILREAKTWQLRGEIFGEIATQIVIIRQVGIGDLNELPKVDNPGLISFESFSKALELSEKKFETTDALKGLQGAQSNLYSLGIYMYEEANYANAFSNFQAILSAHNLLKKNGQMSSIDEEQNYNDLLYVTGLAALNAGKSADAKYYFEELYKKHYDKPAIYEALFNIYQGENPEKAYAYLKEGRTAYPEEVSLLFAEINYFLQTGRLNELISNLEMATKKEPENVSLYSTLGNVYDNLYQSEQAAGNSAKASEYFDKALENYNTALAKNPENFDAVYSTGALYYNKAAFMTQELSALADDYSKEGLKKYETKQAEVYALFDKALPYFQKAESMNPNDVSTLVALKEIYARKNQLDISDEFKKRLENVQSGGSNGTAYFKQ